MLDNVLAFTSQDEFIAHNIYKVVSHNYSENQSIDLIIEGDINTYEYSLALISMLPAYAKFPNQKSISLKYSNLNKENFNDALLIEAIRSKYPKRLVEYLLTRAECLFEMDGLEVADQMNLDINYLKHYLASESNKKAIKNKSLTSSIESYKVLVNGIQFEMVPAFYIELDEPSLNAINPEDNDWGYMDCMSRSYVSNVNFLIDKEHLEPDDFTDQEFVFYQKDMYVSLICCTSENKQNYLRQIKNYFLSPSYDLIGALSDCNYTTTSKYINPIFFVNTCSNTPFKFYEEELKISRENRKHIVPNQ
jgi:hypothetical protein